MILVAFLGNPGTNYRKHRHNVAWQLIESCYPSLSWQQKFKAEYTRYETPDSCSLFLKPQTFMNKSGESVASCMQFFKITPENLLVVHDELELDYGVIGLKSGGSPAGHNGLRSIASLLGTRDFNRLRIGIGRPSRGDVTSYVLGNFSSEEEITLPHIFDKAAAVIEEFISGNKQKLMKSAKKISVF